MAGTGASSPFIKDEPEDSQLFGHQSQRFMSGHQNFNMNQTPFQYTTGVNPGDLTMGSGGMSMQNGGNFGTSFNSGTYNGGGGQGSNPNQSFSKGISTFGDDELLDSLGAMNDPHSHQGGMQYNTYPDDFQQSMYTNGNSALSIDINGYSNTPDGDPIASPFANSSFTHAQFRHIQSPSNVLHSPGSYTGSPLAGSEQVLNGTRQPQRPSLSRVQRKHSGNSMRSPLSPKIPVISSLNIGPAEHSSFSQPIRTTQSHRHQKNLSGQWDQTPSSLTSFPGSDFSPLQGAHPNPQISELLLKGGQSMPTKLNNGLQSGSAPALQSQEMKRRRRRESHNLVERRRRDNINERIQELSHLVPMHRLEDEKVRKALQNNSPLSPTLAGLSQPPTSMSPPQATSGLAGPGARRATAGNITTGIPIEEKDKGPNKGDILNGAVSWTRDLMWMLHLKLQQQEELANLIADLGGSFPFEETEDERRMHTELMDSMVKNDGTKFHYSRAPGSGLRVPKHTDVKGDAIGGSNNNQLDNSLSPENHSTGDAGQGLGGPGQYWSGHNSGGSGPGSISFKEEDEYGMDLTQ